jgi:hypothetical protein
MHFELSTPILFDAQIHAHLLPQIWQIHRACILQDGQILALLPGPDGDVSTADIENFWITQCAPQQELSRREIVLQMSNNDQHGTTEVLGLAVLDMPWAETGPFRCWVQKLSV